MKKLIFSLTLFAFSITGLQAQEVFRTLLNKAGTIVNNNDANDYNTKINYFYFTALNYMQTQMQPTDVAQYKILDDQALAMQTFVSNFINWMARIKDTDVRKKGIQLFVDASARHPFFNDKDDETVESFINDANYITPFRLDTDWVSASKEADKELQKLLSESGLTF